MTATDELRRILDERGWCVRDIQLRKLGIEVSE